MTTQQPEALRLACFFESMKQSSHRWYDGTPVHEKAAAELRRLHAENEELKQEIAADQQAAHAVQPFGWFITKSMLPGDTEFTQDPARENLARSFGYQTQPLYAQPAAQGMDAQLWADFEALRHSANEWADMATNGLQWLRNIVDGISDPQQALMNLESNLTYCRAVNDVPAAQRAIKAIAAALAAQAKQDK